MSWQMYWPNWWKLWPYHHMTLEGIEEGDLTFSYWSHVFTFGPFQATWYSS